MIKLITSEKKYDPKLQLTSHGLLLYYLLQLPGNHFYNDVSFLTSAISRLAGHVYLQYITTAFGKPTPIYPWLKEMSISKERARDKIDILASR